VVTSQKRQFIIRIRRGEKITGNDAVSAAQLGLGELYLSCNAEFAFSTVSLGIRTAPFQTEKQVANVGKKSTERTK
jgi:hypothetical protein